MPDILVRGLDDAVVEELKSRARRNRRSLQKEAQAILEYAAAYSITDACRVAEQWHTTLATTSYDDSAVLIREDRGR
ncbi:hypothetical protein JXA88_12600 [Candidatus Fermentibacteria bacterium]|nr:hypothetical protein [Candidatus Fermentibacteria bacterium]